MDRLGEGRSRSRVVALRVDRSAGIWALAAAGAVIAACMAFASPGHAQQARVPEVVRPRSDAPTLPANPHEGPSMPRPRSENPLAEGGVTELVPDNGVIAPPVTGLGNTPVIRPPAAGSMPVIRPPNTSGDSKTVGPR